MDKIELETKTERGVMARLQQLRGMGGTTKSIGQDLTLKPGHVGRAFKRLQEKGLIETYLDGDVRHYRVKEQYEQTPIGVPSIKKTASKISNDAKAVMPTLKGGLVDKLNDLEAENVSLDKQLSEIKLENHKLEAVVNDLRSNITTFRGEKQGLIDKINSLEKKLAKLEGFREGIRTERGLQLPRPEPRSSRREEEYDEDAWGDDI